MKKNINFKAVMSAVAAGGAYELAIQGAAKKVDFVNQNYLVTKSLTAGILGTGLLYFGKPNDEAQKAAGYALLGVGGASGAGKISTLIVTSGNEPMNGRRARLLKNVISRTRANVNQIKRDVKRDGVIDAIRQGGGRLRREGRKIASEQMPGSGYWKSQMKRMF